MVKKFRINNDIEVNWTVNLKKPDGSLVDLTTIPLGVKLVIGTKEYPITVANSGLVIYGNLISFTFYGYRQEYTGAYIIKLFDTNSDSVTYDVCNAFILVDHSWQSADVLSYPGIVDADSSIDVNRVLTIYSQIVPATSEALGGIRLGYEQSGDNYPVQTDANGRAYVNVPGGGGGGGSAVAWGEGGDDYVWLNVNGVEKSLLTAHQSLSGYATKTWVGDQGFLTNINSSMITTALGYTPADSDDFSNYLALSGGAMWNTDLVSNLNAELLDGHSLLQLTSPISPRDFENGTLVTTSIDYSQSEGAAFYMEIAADTYDWDGNGPLLTLVQGYIYDNTIINYGVTNLGHYRLNTLYAMNINGHLCFWWPRLSMWQSFRVGVYDSSAGDYRKNLVTAIADSVKPNGTKEVLLTDSLFNSAFTTDNVASATKLETARTIWGQPFDGTLDVSGDLEIGTDKLIFGTGAYMNYVSANVGVHFSVGIYSDTYMTCGEVLSSSDIRLKKDIEDIFSDRALSVLMRLKPKEWVWNDNSGLSGKRSAGLIAQEVEDILPDAVSGEDYFSINYNMFHPYEIAVIQNHEERIDILEQKIKQLEMR